VMSSSASVLPPAAQLARTFDVARLIADIERLDPDTWKRLNYVDEQAVIHEITVDWRCLPLRVIGGDPRRTDAGSPGLVDYANTKWFDQATYLAEIVTSIPAPILDVRLLALGGGMEGPEHNDARLDLRYGLARLHVPITTTPGSRLYLDNQVYQWKPGTFWFGDFNRIHKVENTDSVLRIHMVFDVLVSKGLLELFPSEYRALLGGEVIVNRPPVPLSPAERARLRVSFRLPVFFPNVEGPEDDFLQPQDQRHATIDDDGSRMILSLDGRPTIALVHIGDNEFRFLGWSDERTMQVSPNGDTVMLRMRAGAQVRQQEIQAARL